MINNNEVIYIEHENHFVLEIIVWDTLYTRKVCKVVYNVICLMRATTSQLYSKPANTKWYRNLSNVIHSFQSSVGRIWSRLPPMASDGTIGDQPAHIKVSEMILNAVIVYIWTIEIFYCRIVLSPVAGTWQIVSGNVYSILIHTSTCTCTTAWIDPETGVKHTSKSRIRVDPKTVPILSFQGQSISTLSLESWENSINIHGLD